MAAYAWIMESNSIPVSDVAFLAHLYPVDASDGPMVEFSKDFFEVDVSSPRRMEIQNLMEEVVLCLEGPQPNKNPDCEFCNYRG